MPAPVVRVVTRIQDQDDINWPVSDGQSLMWDASSGKFVGSPATGSDISFVFSQDVAATVWVIVHNLGKHPSVTVVDSAGSVVEGDVQYTSLNSCTLTFSAMFAGKAYLN